MRVTAVEPGRWVRYRIFPGLEGSLEVQTAGTGTRFTATIQMGIRAPVLGAMIDALLRWTIRTRIESIRLHQAEEGANLKALLENRNQGGKIRSKKQ